MTQDALYFVEDDFLSEEECSVLIAIAQKYFGSSGSGFSIHGGRQTHPNTDLDFHDLLKSSEEWRRLDERLSGEEFFQHVFGKLGFKTPGRSFRVIRLFTSEFLFRGPFFGRIKKYTARAFPPGLPTQAIAAILAARFFHFARRLLVGGTNLLTGKKPVELLYDYSAATDGYSREIHRDSDSRRVVFLLYLNGLSGEAEGGALELYKPKQTPEKFSPQPDDSDCELKEVIKPKAGRLVCFRNTATAYHAVPVMKGHKDLRHFVYGGYTQLIGKNADVSDSTRPLEIELSLYT